MVTKSPLLSFDEVNELQLSLLFRQSNCKIVSNKKACQGYITYLIILLFARNNCTFINFY